MRMVQGSGCMVKGVRGRYPSSHVQEDAAMLCVGDHEFAGHEISQLPPAQNEPASQRAQDCPPSGP